MLIVASSKVVLKRVAKPVLRGRGIKPATRIPGGCEATQKTRIKASTKRVHITDIMTLGTTTEAYKKTMINQSKELRKYLHF